MIRGLTKALRFQKGWKGGAPRVREMEVGVPVESTPIPATLFLPEKASSPLPGWVILHGITRPGRQHPTLLRFVRALASSGAAVLVPEIREWTELRLAPLRAAEILKASILALADREETTHGRLGAMGFSFGSPHVLMAGADPKLSPHLSAVVGFGGFADLERTLRFMFQGEHEFDGEAYSVDPDPYGRWVVTGNYLPEAPGFEGTEDVAESLIRLAKVAGDAQVGAWEDVYDGLKEELEMDIHPSRREIFRALAPPAGAAVPRELTDGLVPALAKAALADSSNLDFMSKLSEIRVPVRLIHGRQDKLVPFTETLRLARGFPPEADLRVYITGLFSHSQQGARGAFLPAMSDRVHFIYLMSEILGLV
jgi:pimeloyl-ACP methyl ester carboxylesterase